MQLLRAIERFGVRAITGRDTIRPSLISRAMLAENIVNAYQARARSVNWDTFAKDFSDETALLLEAEKLANE